MSILTGIPIDTRPLPRSARYPQVIAFANGNLETIVVTFFGRYSVSTRDGATISPANRATTSWSVAASLSQVPGGYFFCNSFATLFSMAEAPTSLYRICRIGPILYMIPLRMNTSQNMGSRVCLLLVTCAVLFRGTHPIWTGRYLHHRTEFKQLVWSLALETRIDRHIPRASSGCSGV